MSDSHPDSQPKQGLPVPAPESPPGKSPPPSLPEADAGARALEEALRSSFFFVKLLMILLVLAFLGSGFFIVKQNQVAVVLRFGKPVGEAGQQVLQPGFHWAFPYPLDEIVTIPVGESHVVNSTSGWYATTPQLEAENKEPEAKPSLTPGVDNYTLTADGNIIHVRASLKYRITNPWQYAFAFDGITNLIQNVLNNALNYASAHYTAEAALYKDPTGFNDLVRARVNQAIETYQLGITLEPLIVRTQAPLWVRSAFEQVQGAEQERSKKINDAEGYARETILKAQGEAKARISEGLIWSNQLVLAVSAEQSAFTNQLPYYLQNPALVKKRLLSETLEHSLAIGQDKFILLQPPAGKSQELRLMLNREPLGATNKPSAQQSTP